MKSGTYLLITLCLFIAGNCAADLKPFRLNSGAPESLSNDVGDGFYNLVATEIFKRMGMSLVYIRLPSQRSLIQANHGIDDGNIARVKGIEKKWTNLIRVPEPIIEWEFTAYVAADADNNIQIDGWSSILNYPLGYVRGWQIYDKHTKSAANAVKADNPSQLFTLLRKNRIKIALFERLQSKYWFQKINYSAMPLSPPLAKKPLFIYVHQRHKDLIATMSGTIKKIKTDGTYRKIYDKSFK